MNWYIARMVFSVGLQPGSGQFDTQYRLILASSEGLALEKANAMGNSEESAGKVKWFFQGVTALVQINPPGDGAELFSEISEPAMVNEFLERVNTLKKLTETKVTPLETADAC